MSKKTIRLLICILMVIISVCFLLYCVLKSDRRLGLSVISVLGTAAILLKEILIK